MFLFDLNIHKDSLKFPPLHYAWGEDSPAPGLLARGGDLSVERLKEAYREGIFPWFNQGDLILWWSLDPRMVLYPSEFILSKSLKKTLKQFLKQADCDIRIDTAFEQTIRACADSERKGQQGTWITDEIQHAYTHLHQAGWAHSFEVWMDGALVGGLYGVSIGGVFYGESMFSHQSNASKLALCGLIAYALTFRIQLIDCQQETAHMKSLGARAIKRDAFVLQMKQAQQRPWPPWAVGELSKECWKALLHDDGLDSCLNDC